MAESLPWAARVDPGGSLVVHSMVVSVQPRHADDVVALAFGDQAHGLPSIANILCGGRAPAVVRRAVLVPQLDKAISRSNAENSSNARIGLPTGLHIRGKAIEAARITSHATTR